MGYIKPIIVTTVQLIPNMGLIKIKTMFPQKKAILLLK